MQPRIYHPSPLNAQLEVTLTAQASNHCAKVLRLKPGQSIELFCGDGFVYPAKLISIGKSVLAKTDQAIPLSSESPVEIHLGQGLARHDRMDWIIQKAVECGVTSITPLITEKSIVKIKTDRLQHKLTHWQHIMIAACEQSGRTQIPSLHSPMPIQSWIEQPFKGQSVVFHPNADHSIKSINSRPSSLRVLLGPESGLSLFEVQQAQKTDFIMCHLGPRILRTETATIAALATLQAQFGDF